MTIIAGYADGKNTWMAGDRAASGNSSCICLAKPKIFTKTIEGCGEVVIGYTTSFRMGQLLEYKFSPPELHKCSFDHYLNTVFIDEIIKILHKNNFTSESSNVIEGGTFLVGAVGRIFTIQDDFSIIESALPFAAIGCGFQYSLGAMSALVKSDKTDEEKIVKEGVLAAVEFSPYCGVHKEIDFIKV